MEQAAENARRDASPSSNAAHGRIEALVFELAAERYALPMTDVLEVLRAVALRSLPLAPAVVEGVFDLRGELVPVIDLRARFRLPSRTLDPSEHLIVARAGARTVALRVDQALALEPLEAVALEHAGNLPRGLGSLAGVASTEAGMVLIHDLRAFLSEAEALELERALDRLGSGAPEPGAP